jgi:hypothetical protein
MVKKSLGTKNVAEAKRRAHPLAVQTEAEFEAARKHQTAPIRTELTDREMAFLVDAYHHQLLAADDAARIDGSGEDDHLYKTIKAQVEAEGGTAGFSHKKATTVVGLSPRAYEKRTETLEIVLPGLREKLARGDTASTAFDVDVFLEIHGIKLDTGSASYRRLCFEFLRTAVRATEAMVQRHGGELVDTPPAPAPLVNGSSVKPAPDGLDLQSMFDEWVAERKPSPKTVLDFTTAGTGQEPAMVPSIPLGSGDVVQSTAVVRYIVSLGNAPLGPQTGRGSLHAWGHSQGVTSVAPRQCGCLNWEGSTCSDEVISPPAPAPL